MRLHVTISEFRRTKCGMKALVNVETEHGQDISSPSPRFAMPWHYSDQVDAFTAPGSVTAYLGQMFDNVQLESVDEREPWHIHQTYTGTLKARIAQTGWIQEHAING